MGASAIFLNAARCAGQDIARIRNQQFNESNVIRVTARYSLLFNPNFYKPKILELIFEDFWIENGDFCVRGNGRDRWMRIGEIVLGDLSYRRCSRMPRIGVTVT